jgi:hypothetical protein
MTDIVKVALIAAMPGIVGSVLSFLNRLLIKKVEKNTNNKLDTILSERNAASARADRAEGMAQGVKQEQDRSK